MTIFKFELSVRIGQDVFAQSDLLQSHINIDTRRAHTHLFLAVATTSAVFHCDITIMLKSTGLKVIC